MNRPSGNAVFRGTGPSSAVRARHWWRQSKFWVLCAAVFLVLSLIAFLASGSGKSSSGTLSITNPAPAGAQAGAEVLRQQGVQVTAVASLAAASAALAAQGNGNSTVLFHDPNRLLPAGQLAKLVQAVRDNGARLVVVSPGPLAVKELGPGFSSAGSAAETDMVEANCNYPPAVAAGKIDGGAPSPGEPASVPSTLVLYKGAQNCFTPAGADPASGGLLALDGTGDIAVLGHPGIAFNQNLPRLGNAALTFGLLGGTPELLWYTASLQDVPAAEQPPSLAEFTPRWVFPAALWLLLVAVVGMFWKGRRHGPLVTEPLPVMVKSAEMLAGRARLYQDARAAGTAGRALRRATLTRLAQQLRLGHFAGPDAVVEAVAAATGRERRDVAAQLMGPDARTDKELLTMAVDLAALEEEVARQ
ncbi:DUF4350 domain-containing protein [Specibacter sp. NPDC057265]|uniref:DUF4350 domain-containing protein n=1 Tax=Specibacter sp. NPDC057265 TaxID=3346075 RepID=UPI003626454A